MSWKKGILRSLLGLATVLLILSAGGYIFVRTGFFKRLVIQKIEEKTRESTGEQLSIGKMVIHWTRLEADFYNVVLREPSMSPPPFFSCGHLEVSVKIASLWKREFALKEVVLNQPTVHILITAQGQSNLPHFRSTEAKRSSSTAETIFSLGLRHFVVTSGEIAYNDQKFPVSADLRDLRAKAQFNPTAQAYQGSLAYDRGMASGPHVLPFQHDLDMDFVATRTEFRVTSLRAWTGRTRFELEGAVADYAQPRVQAVYQAAIFTPDLARILDTPSIPAGEVRTSGSVRYDSGSHEPFLDTIHAEGQMDAPRVLARVANVYVEARRVQANYVLQHGNILVPHLAGQALGGSLNGSFSMLDLAKRPESRLNATVRGASLAQLMRFDPSKRQERLGLAGKTDAQVQATWAGSFADAMVHVRATIYGPLESPLPKTIPLNGFLDVRYNGARDSATFAPSNLRTEDTELSFEGTLSKNSSLSVQASAGNLAEISRLVSSVEASGSAGNESSSLASLELRGSAKFAGDVRGSPENPRIRGHLVGNHVFLKGTYLSTVNADVDVGASSISVQNGSLRGATNGELTLNGDLGLHDWSFTRTGAISLHAKASSLSVPDLARIANLRYPVSGTLDGEVSVHGSEENPAGQAVISISKVSAPEANPIEKIVPPGKFLALHLEGNGDLVHATAQLNTIAGQISVVVAYAPKTEHYDGRMEAPSLDLNKLASAERQGLALAGTANLSANGSGSIQRPQADVNLEIPALEIQGQAISAIHSQVHIADGHATFALSSSVVGGYVQAKGDVALSGNYAATASLDVRALPIGPLLATYVPRIPEGLEGQTDLHATLSGSLKKPKQITAQVQVPRLNLAYQSVQIGLAAPTSLHYGDGVISMSKTEMKGNGTNLTLQGTIPVKSAQPLDIAANGSIDLALLQTFGVGIRSSGRVILNVAATGGISNPSVHGEIQIASATFLSDTLPIAVESLNGKIRVSGTRLDIEQLQGTVGGGNLSASGFLDYGARPHFKLAAEAKSVRIRYPQGIRTLMQANLDLTGSPGKSSLTGRVLVDRLSFTPQFDMASLIGQFASEIPSAGPPAFEQNMKLHVTVASTDALNLTSSKLSIGGNFNLTVAGTMAEPVVLGRVALTQGEVFFLGKRYEIQSGTIEFANPVRTEPVLNIYASTTVSQYNLTLNFVGPIDRLRTNYTSTPPLSEADIIHLIAFGTTAEQAATSPSTPASVAAESVLAQGVTSQVSGKLEKLTGISQITIDPLVTNSQANPGSQIAIQERVSGSLLLTFSTSVTDTQANTIEVQYTTPQHARISVLRDYNGGYALDVRFRKTF